MSFTGVGNAVIGTAAADLLEFAFTSEENKQAIKKDIQNLVTKFQRSHRIHNMKPNFNGQLPYFDVELGVVIYK
jgi:hypothetical protein